MLACCAAHWNDLSSTDMDLSLFRPVYSPKDFLEVLCQLHSPNHAPQGGGHLGRPFGLIQVGKHFFFFDRETRENNFDIWPFSFLSYHHPVIGYIIKFCNAFRFHCGQPVWRI